MVCRFPSYNSPALVSELGEVAARWWLVLEIHGQQVQLLLCSPVQVPIGEVRYEDGDWVGSGFT